MEMTSYIFLVGCALEFILIGGSYVVGWYDGRVAEKEAQKNVINEYLQASARDRI